jgi:outer membrane protein assembly factor BamB
MTSFLNRARWVQIICRLVPALLLTLPVYGEVGWPQFRGPNGSGVSEAGRPPTHFGATTNLAWKLELAAGASSPCVWDDWIFLTAFADGKLETLGIRRSEGKVVWRQPAPTERIEPFHPTEGSPASGTPATDGKRVYVYFGSAGLLCYDLAGKEHWRLPLPVPTQIGDFGSGCSPMVANGLVLLNRDQQEGSCLLAVEASTGKIAWRADRPGFFSSFGTPILWSHDQVEEVVLAGSFQMKAYDLQAGQERWAVAGLPAAVCTTPVLGDGLLLFAGWSPGKSDSPMPTFDSMLERYDKNKDGVIDFDEVDPVFKTFFVSYDLNRDKRITREEWETFNATIAKGENVLLAIRPGGTGDVTATHVAWKQTRGLPYVASPLFYRGRIYLVKDGGLVSCYEAATGKSVYQERLGAQGSYYASPVAADGRLYFASVNGTVTVITAADQFAVLARAELGERIVATPAPVENALYVRTSKHLFAFRE